MSDLLPALTREGVLISVSVRYWRGCKKLKPEDLGLDGDKVSDRLISLGHKRLLPKEATASLSLIEGRAHALVEANTFPFLKGLAHYLPNARLSEVTGKLRSLEDEFWAAKESFIEHYGRLRESAAGEWREMAEKLVDDPARLVAAVEDSFPLVQKMGKYFGFETDMFQIAAPEKIALELVNIADQQNIVAARQQASQEAAAKIRRDVESFAADCVASLREQTAKLCSEMLASINGCETGVHQKTLNRLVKFIDQFRQMNFLNDTEMEGQLERVRRELLSRTAEEYRDSSTARNRLKQGLTQLGEEARRLAQADAKELVQSFGEQGRRRFHLAA
jgi:hypothetical protein